MSPKRVLSIALQVAVVLAVLALIAGQLLGQPVLFSFVETGSMQPTLDPGDGFIAIPRRSPATSASATWSRSTPRRLRAAG